METQIDFNGEKKLDHESTIISGTTLLSLSLGFNFPFSH